MKKFIVAFCIVLTLTLSPVSAVSNAPSVVINGTAMGNNSMARIHNGSTYVSLRMVSAALDASADIWWENGAAYIRTERFLLTARPNETYIDVNGSKITVPHKVIMEEGRVYVPLRALAKAFDAVIYWDPIQGEADLITREKQTSASYNEDEIYWLSRIISAESRGEPLEGKIAVGNVVLNRVKSSEFPNTIYGVIFDRKWGVQFEPVSNGTIYQNPTAESILAAKLCLLGESVIGESLYFLAPALAQNFWSPKNREYFATIGCHEFYL